MAVLCALVIGQNELFPGLVCLGGAKSCGARPPANRATRRDASRGLGLPTHPATQAPRTAQGRQPSGSSSPSSAPVQGVLSSQPVPFQSLAERPPTRAYVLEMDRRIESVEKARSGKGLSDNDLARKLVNAEADLRDAEYQARAGKGEYDEYLDYDLEKAARAAKEADINRRAEEYVRKYGAKPTLPPKTLTRYRDKEETFGLDNPIGRGKVDGVNLDLFNPATQVKFDPEAAPGSYRSLSSEPPTKGVLKEKSKINQQVTQSFGTIEDRFLNEGATNAQVGDQTRRFAGFLGGGDEFAPKPATGDQDETLFSPDKGPVHGMPKIEYLKMEDADSPT